MATRLYPDWQIASTETEIAYVGNGWTQNQTDDDGHNALKYAWTATTNSTAVITPTYKFKTAFLYLYAGKDAGIIEVLVNGKQSQVIDMYLYLDGANTMKNACVRVDCDFNDNNVITLRCTGQKNAASTNTKLGITRVIIRDESDSSLRVNQVLVFGDSNTASQISWADAVVKSDVSALNIGSPITFAYATRPGGTSLYLDRFAAAEIDATRSGGIVSMLGTNNMGNSELRGNDSTVNSVKVLHGEAKKRNLPLMICTILPRNDATFYVNQANATIKQYTNDNKDIQLFDVAALFNNTPAVVSPFKTDGIHLDVYGHEIVGHAFFDNLIKPSSLFRNMFMS